MSLTKQDLEAIGGLIAAIRVEIEERLAPMQDTLKEVLKTQVDNTKQIQFIQFQLEGLKTDVYALRHEVAGFRHEIDGIKHDIKGLRLDVDTLKQATA
jgi:uncharacterized protein YoxC